MLLSARKRYKNQSPDDIRLTGGPRAAMDNAGIRCGHGSAGGDALQSRARSVSGVEPSTPAPAECVFLALRRLRFGHENTAKFQKSILTR